VRWVAAPRENLATAMAKNQLNLSWYARPDAPVHIYRYRLTVKSSAPALVGEVAPQPGIPTLGSPEVQYFNPGGFWEYGEVTREWVGTIQP
jgi:hypothetical protein